MALNSDEYDGAYVCGAVYADEQSGAVYRPLLGYYSQQQDRLHSDFLGGCLE